MSNSLVLGIGNILLKDEGAGIHAMQYLERHHRLPHGAKCLDGGTLSFTLAGDIESADNLVVIDAARMGEAAGTVRCFIGPDFDDFIGRAKLSAHEVGLADLMDIARLSENLPENRALVGIEPEALDWGDTPGRAVEAAIPVAADAVVALLRDWGA